MQKQPDPQKLSMQDAMKLANSPAGQQLLALLRNSHGDKIDQALAQASSGDYAQLSKTMQTLMASSEARALLEQLRGYQLG